MKRALLAAAVAATGLATSFSPAPAAPEKPNPHTQPILDGCQRSNAMHVTTTTPEWVYVYRDQVLADRAQGISTAGRQTVEGPVTNSRMPGEDLFFEHDTYDINVNVVPAPSQEFVLTADQEESTIHAEAEVAAFPLWVMPSVGDRARLSGSWIWDCGHWGNQGVSPFEDASQFLPYDPASTVPDVLQPGTIRGEETELHPLYEMATFRRDAAGILRGGRRATRLSRLDVWITGDGSPALAVVECALYGIGVGGILSNTGACPRIRDVGGTYRYTMNLGPKPSRSSRIVVNPVVLHRESNTALRRAPVRIVPRPRANAVDVSFTLPHVPFLQRFGITVEAGWTGAEPAVRHRVRFDRVHIQRSLDGESEPNNNPGDFEGEQAPDPGEWVLYANVNGNWLQLPHVSEVRDGQTIKIGAELDFWLPRGVRPSLFVTGRECDTPLMHCGAGFGARFDPLRAFMEFGFNDNPGRIQTARESTVGVPLRRGTGTYAPPLNPSQGEDENLADRDCDNPATKAPESCYQLTVTVR